MEQPPHAQLLEPSWLALAARHMASLAAGTPPSFEGIPVLHKQAPDPGAWTLGPGMDNHLKPLLTPWKIRVGPYTLHYEKSPFFPSKKIFNYKYTSL
jgi:hypothetical protein